MNTMTIMTSFSFEMLIQVKSLATQLVAILLVCIMVKAPALKKIGKSASSIHFLLASLVGLGQLY